MSEQQIMSHNLNLHASNM